MTPSRLAAIAATCGTPPESTASRRTLSMAVPSIAELMRDLLCDGQPSHFPWLSRRERVVFLILMYYRREGQGRRPGGAPAGCAVRRRRLPRSSWPRGAPAERTAGSAARTSVPPGHVEEQAPGQQHRGDPEDDGRPAGRVRGAGPDGGADNGGSRGQADGD